MKIVEKLVKATKKTKVSLFLVLLSYLFFTIFYMGPSTWDCKNTLYGFGDNTAGPIWRYELEPKQPPLGTYTNQTNYPVGEDLYSPTSYSLVGQTMLIWSSSRLLGPICGYNVVNMVGFIASAGVMYGFIVAVTKKRWIAWLAGYAVSFSPYFQMKVGGHPGYGYQALLIGSAWALFNLLTHKRKKDALIFGVVSATTAYFDPYFSLLLASIVGPILGVWLGIQWLKGRKSHNERKLFYSDLKRVLLGFAILGALLLPLAGVILKNSSEISSSVAALRGNVLFEAKSCSNLPHEYAVPFVLHPVFQRAFGKEDYVSIIDSLHSGFTCGIGEDTVGISMIILAITSTGLIIFCWERLNKRKPIIPLGYDKKLLLAGMIGVVLVAGLIALPPIKLMGIIPTPSYILLEITSTWRTLTRLYVPANFAVITLFSIILTYIVANFSKYRKTLKVLFIMIFLIVFVEYQAFKPFIGNKLSTFSYKTDVPQIYSWLRDQQDIKVVAEYPTERAGGESNAMAYYLSMQNVHKKVLFNSNNPLAYEEDLRASLKDISDIQTLRVLRGTGVDHVIIHGVEEKEISKIQGLEIVRVAPQSPFSILAFTPLVKNDITIIAKITAEPQHNMLKFENGFVRNATIIKSAIDWEYEAVNESVMKVSPLPGSNQVPEGIIKNCFEIRMAVEEGTAQLFTTDETGQVTTSTVGTTYAPITIVSNGLITLKNDKGYNMRVRNIGCSS